ncbi:Hpt domain-containing protein [Vibrio ziniensis]|uniref:Hpt domain-containing protein n=1 Tax=Vibrio ziniensis TaxID=2711221 RepID=A0A6G7CGN0_9VIBR|nr:Hpt domain-containing protein [Vibrio ziniensis]QIH41267.1 Hpt domain-containing protein [Vibrio ziniensis]
MALGYQGGRLIYKALAVIGMVWLLFLLAIFSQYRETSKMSGNVVELGNNIMSFHNSLHFKSPYRVTHANDMSLNLQLIYSLRVQLEADYRDSWLQPDVTHLIYVIDKFIEKSQLFLSKDLDILNMVEQLRSFRAEYENKPEIRRYYIELGAYLFESLFTEGEQSPEVYRSLDRIMVASQSISLDDRQHLQLTLAKVAKLLNQYAESGNLVDRLLQHEIYHELHTLEHKYYELFGLINLLMFILGGALFVCVVSATLIDQSRCRRMLQSLDIEEEQEAITDQISTQKKVRSEVMVGSDHLPIAKLPVESKIDIPQMLSSLNDDKESVKMLLRVFIEDHNKDCEKLMEQLSSDLGAAMRTAHSLKGVAGTIGANELKIIAIEIEAKLKKEQVPTDAEITNLEKCLDETVKSAQFWLDKASF